MSKCSKQKRNIVRCDDKKAAFCMKMNFLKDCQKLDTKNSLDFRGKML